MGDRSGLWIRPIPGSEITNRGGRDVIHNLSGTGVCPGALQLTCQVLAKESEGLASWVSSPTDSLLDVMVTEVSIYSAPPMCAVIKAL